MTLEEAIKEIQKVVDECPWPGTVEEHQQLLAWLKDYQTMLSKPERTAKVMNIHDEYDVDAIRYFKVGLCGNCEAWLEQGDIYCSECGARLEWE